MHPLTSEASSSPATNPLTGCDSARRARTLLALLGPGGLILLLPVGPLARPPAAHAEPAAPSFEADVRPILQAHCVRCHGGTPRKGGFDMRSLASLLEGGKSGLAVKPGSVEGSLLLARVTADEMPPGKDKLTPAQKVILRDWIAAGAKGAGGVDVVKAAPPPVGGKGAGKEMPGAVDVAKARRDRADRRNREDRRDRADRRRRGGRSDDREDRRDRRGRRGDRRDDR